MVYLYSHIDPNIFFQIEIYPSYNQEYNYNNVSI